MNNPAMYGTRGMLGKTLVYKDWYGRTLVTNKPKKRKSISEKQVTTIDNFKSATRFAKKLMKLPEKKALYERGINERQRSAYAVALKDILNKPIIEEIDIKDYNGRAGEMIRVRAFDDFMVMSVIVTVRTTSGNLVETGHAQARGKRGLWRFMTTTGIPDAKGLMIVAEAKDVAGNTVLKEIGCIIEQRQ
ncbi:hypothetical protein WBG78_24820 [Chryseolinea sp. T2]|uniref:hypothetical protein n=1 Tax=Chryseolinea sp. T2 TaxID=3129255 RepID=UPI003076CA67